MKLSISLLVLAALSNAASPQSTAKSSVVKSSVAKSSVTKQKHHNQTSKRELYEGNFGERNKELISNYAVPANSPKIEYAEDLKMIPDQSAEHKNFGVRLPQIVKISDVLSGQGPSFEAAVAKHLYSPISVYHARHSSPTSFEVPIPAASQLAYPNTKTYQFRKSAENQQRLQEVSPKGVGLPGIPLYTVKQPRLRFESYPQSLDPGFSRQHTNLPQEIFQPQHLPRQPILQLFPIYDQLGPIKFQENIIPSQYLNQNGIYQLIPINPGFGYGNQGENRGKSYPNQESHEELKAEPTEKPEVQNEVPVPKQGYHAHPNGAISFASFSQNLPVNTQYGIAQSENLHQAVELPPPPRPIVQLLSQEQKLAPVKQKLLYLPIFHTHIQDLHKYQPDYQPKSQFITFKQEVQNQPRILNALQQHLLNQDPRQTSDSRVIQLQRLPAFKPLPQSQLVPESFFQQTSSSPIEAEPRPFSSDDQSKSPPSHIDQPIAPVSQQRQLTPLPPLKPNYSKYVKPLQPRSRTTSVFLPTSLQMLPTSTPTEQPAHDQLISSTTLQPDVKDQEESKEQSIQIETQPQSQTSQPLEPEIIHQSQPTILPLAIQPTTYRPFATHEAHFQHSTPQSEYLSTIRPQSIQTSPRHDVIIQQQEIQELIFEPSTQPSSTSHYQQQQTQIRQHLEQEVQQLQSQEQHQLYKQLQPLQFQQELQELQSQQYQLKAGQLEFPQKQYAIQQIEPQQYTHPLEHHEFQPKQLQTNQQPKLEQSQQQQQGTEQTQPQQYQQHHLAPNNQIQVSTAMPSQEPEKKPEPQAQLQHEPILQPTTGKPNEQSEKLSEATPNSEQPYLGPSLSPLQSVLRQLYAQSQHLVDPSYSDVQYFGKFAEPLFGNRQH